MKTIKFRIDEDIPVVAEADVLVVGGGPGGLGAAIMAARMGATVVLAERFGQLGGMASAGEVSPFMWNHWRPDPNRTELVALDKPIYGEWIRRMAAYLPPETVEANGGLRPEADTNFSHIISKEYAALAAEDLCLEAGVKILYHFELVKAIVEDGVIQAAVFATKSGFAAIRAANYIDATGDADLTVLAGGRTDIGGPSGYCQPMTLCFKMSNIDQSRLPEDWRTKRYEAAVAAGKIHCPRENILCFATFDDDTLHFNTTRIVKRSPVDALDLNEAELEAHRQMREIARWLIAEVPGFEHARISSSAARIGVRESRRIRGIRRLGREVFTERRKFPDAVLRCNYTIDIHNPTGTGTEIESMPNTEYFEIPYGCIVPEGVKNLVVGGRPISVDQALHSSCRVMPPAISLGQAAGVAAAMSCQSGTALPDLDGVKVRGQLRALGANL